MTAALLLQILLGLFGSFGVIGAVIAYRKLPGEQASMAVTQSQGAMEIMRGLNDELVEDRDRWRERAKEAERSRDKWKSRAEIAEARLNDLGAR